MIRIVSTVAALLLAASTFAFVLASAGCAGGSTVAADDVPVSVAPRPYLVWDVTTERGHSQGSSATGAGEHLWSVAPEHGPLFGVTFDADDLVGLRFEAPRQLVPGVLALTDEQQASLWTSGCASWTGAATIASDLPHWALSLDGTCADDPTRFLRARLEGWID